MANHVENYIKVKNINGKVAEELKRIFSNKDKIGDTYTIDLINSIYDKNWNEEDCDSRWIDENIGSKWVFGHIGNETEDEVSINLTSAWSAVNPLLEQLSKKLISIKEDVVIENKFEDEGLDFLGVSYFSLHYNSEEYLDEEVDVDRFNEDDEYKEEIYEMLEELMDDERRCHREVLDELN